MGKAIVLMVLITLAATAAGIAVRRLMRGRSRAARNVLLVLIAVVGFTGINFVGGYIMAPACFLKDFPDESAHRYVVENSTAEKISIDGKYGRLEGWLLRAAGEATDGESQNGAVPGESDGIDGAGAGEKSLLIYFGGNKECSALRMRLLAEYEEYDGVFGGYDFACVDYYGYCESGGTAGVKTFKQYGLEVYDYLTASQGYDRVYIMGYSIGTGVANYVASRRECGGLVLLAPYSNGSDLYNTVCNIFHGPLKLLVGFNMDSDEYAQSIDVKPLILAASEDTVIPWECAETLSGNYPEGAEFILLDDIGHSDIWFYDAAMEHIEEYLH